MKVANHDAGIGPLKRAVRRLHLKVASSPVVFRDAHLFCKVALAKADDFELLRVVLVYEGDGNTHVAGIIARYVGNFRDVNTIEVRVRRIVFQLVPAKENLFLMALSNV